MRWLQAAGQHVGIAIGRGTIANEGMGASTGQARNAVNSSGVYALARPSLVRNFSSPLLAGNTGKRTPWRTCCRWLPQ